MTTLFTAALAPSSMALLCTLSFACKSKSEGVPPPSNAVRSAPVAGPADANVEPAKKAFALPTEGMACAGSGPIVLWYPDGQFDTAPGAPRMVGSHVPGSLAVVHATVPRSVEFLSSSKPRLQLPPDVTGDPVVLADGSVLAPSPRPVFYWLRDGGKTELELPSGLVPSTTPRAALVGETLWLVVQGTLLRTRDGALEKVPMFKENTKVLGLGTVEGRLYLATAIYTQPKQVQLWTLGEGDKPVKVTTVDELDGDMQLAMIRSNRRGVVAVGLKGLQAKSEILVVDVGGATQRIRDSSLLLAIDDHDRIWLARGPQLVAHGLDGSETSYVESSHPSIAMLLAGDRYCEPIGGGFTTLPAAGEAQYGTLQLVVYGKRAAKAPFVACDSPTLSNPPCGTSPKVSGTLDSSGGWTGRVTVGTYSVAVKTSAGWMGTTKDRCYVTANTTCRLEVYVRD